MNTPALGPKTRWRGRGTGDRGAALTETALLAPWFFLLVFGIIEFGMAFRDRLSVDSATQNGARMGAIQGDGLATDYAILGEATHYLDIAGDAENVRIVVYKATGPGDAPPAGCTAGNPQLGVCNVYSLTGIDDPTNFGCLAGDLDVSWCPSSRDVTATSGDYLGVWIRAERPYITGLFGDRVTLTASTVVRIEPQDF